MTSSSIVSKLIPLNPNPIESKNLVQKSHLKKDKYYSIARNTAALAKDSVFEL